MPIFEYACKQCNHTFEKLIMNGKTDIACPKCENTEVRKLLSAFSFNAASSSSSGDPQGGCGTCGSDTPGVCGMS